mgnify:CR=1 FL=1
MNQVMRTALSFDAFANVKYPKNLKESKNFSMILMKEPKAEDMPCSNFHYNNIMNI